MYDHDEEVDPLRTCSCGRRFLLEHFYAEAGQVVEHLLRVDPEG